MKLSTWILSALALSLLLDAGHCSPPSLSKSSSSSSFLPSLTSLLSDLWEHPVAEQSVVSLVQRHVRFAVSMLVSPLQLLDFSHFAPPVRTPFPPPLKSPSWPPPQSLGSEEALDGWQQPAVAVIHANGDVDDEEELRLQSDISHALRVSVGAHKQSTAATFLPGPAAAVPLRATEAESPSTENSIPDDVGQLPPVRCGVYGQRIAFESFDGGSTHHLCYCPYDWRGPTCATRVPYRCPVQLVAPSTSCMDSRARPPPTSSQSTSAREEAYSVSPSSSAFFRYEPVLSGTPPPCLSVSGPTVMAVNFTCAFEPGSVGVVEGWGNQTLYELIRQNSTQQEQPHPFAYTVLNTNRSGAVQWAMSQNDSGIRFDVTALNTAHPSQFLFLQQPLLLNASHLRYSANSPGALVQWTLDPRAMERNLKRGGRIHLFLRFIMAGGRMGLNMTSSLMPWRLYVDDATFGLPGPARKVLLTRFQWGVVVFVVLLVAVLLVYRWYQRRQTAKFQQLIAEQKGQQRSWFEASE